MCAEKDLPLHLHDDKRLEEPASGVRNHLLCDVFFCHEIPYVHAYVCTWSLKILVRLTWR